MTDGCDGEILVDTREQKWEQVMQHLSDLGAPNYRLETLHHKADYIVRRHSEIAIQRKSIDDFVDSIDTLKDDLYELRTHYEYGALLIEEKWTLVGGTIAQRRGRTVHQTIPVQSLHNFVLSQQLRGTLFFHTSSLKESCRLLTNIYGYLDGPLSGDGTGDDPSVLLTSLPGIGPKKAERLIEEFGSVGSALQSVSRWDDVKGIGPKTTETIEDWLHQS